MSIEKIRIDLEVAGEYMRSVWRCADDEDPVRRLTLAVEAQQRALESLLLLVESDRKINAAHRGRIDRLELAS